MGAKTRWLLGALPRRDCETAESGAPAAREHGGVHRGEDRGEAGRRELREGLGEARAGLRGPTERGERSAGEKKIRIRLGTDTGEARRAGGRAGAGSRMPWSRRSLVLSAHFGEAGVLRANRGEADGRCGGDGLRRGGRRGPPLAPPPPVGRLVPSRCISSCGPRPVPIPWCRVPTPASKAALGELLRLPLPGDGGYRGGSGGGSRVVGRREPS